MTYKPVPMVNTLEPRGIAIPIRKGLLGLGTTTYVIPSGGTFTAMFNVRGLPSGSASAAASAIGVEVRTIRGISFTYTGWGSGRDAGAVVAQGIVGSDTVPGVLLGKLREAATRAKTRIPGSVTIDTTIRHVPTVARESEAPVAPVTDAPTTTTEPFTMFGMPLWLVGIVGIGAVVGVVLLTRKKAASVAAPLAKNRRRRRMRRNYSFSSWRSSRSSALPPLRRVN